MSYLLAALFGLAVAALDWLWRTEQRSTREWTEARALDRLNALAARLAREWAADNERRLFGASDPAQWAMDYLGAPQAETSYAAPRREPDALDALLAAMHAASPAGHLETVRDLLAEHYGVDFATHTVVLAQDLADEFGIDLPNGPHDDVTTTPFIEGRQMLVMKRADPYLKVTYKPLSWADYGTAAFDFTPRSLR